MISYEIRDRLERRGLQVLEFGSGYWIRAQHGNGWVNTGDILTEQQFQRLVAGETLAEIKNR